MKTFREIVKEHLDQLNTVVLPAENEDLNAEKERAPQIGLKQSEMMADLTDAYAAVCDFDDAGYLLRVYLSEDELEDRFLDAVDCITDLYQSVCKYAAYARAYEKVLSTRGIELSHLIDPDKFDALVLEIRESQKNAAAEMLKTAVVGTSQSAMAN